jgi:hypothetical protein
MFPRLHLPPVGPGKSLITEFGIFPFILDQRTFQVLMSELGLGCVKTKSDLVVVPSGRQKRQQRMFAKGDD